MGKDDPVRRRRHRRSSKKSPWVPPKRSALPSSQGRNKPDWTEPRLKPTGQKEKIENLAKPITFPEKEDEITLDWRSNLRSTEYGQYMQTGREIRSRRARRQEEFQKRISQMQS